MLDKSKVGCNQELNLKQPFPLYLSLISIVMVTYNAAKNLSKDLDSILAQNYPSTELIIIDENSKNLTLDIMKKYEVRFSCWRSKSDEWVYAALNQI